MTAINEKVIQLLVNSRLLWYLSMTSTPTLGESALLGYLTMIHINDTLLQYMVDSASQWWLLITE